MTTPQSQTEQNRRSSRRRGLRCALAIFLADREPQKAMTTDVGSEGLSFYFPKPIAPGTRCRISFELPLAALNVPIAAPIKTVYSSYCGAEGFRIGAVFTDLDPQCNSALLEFTTLDA